VDFKIVPRWFRDALIKWNNPFPYPNEGLREFALFTEENSLTINIKKAIALIFNKRRNFKHKKSNKESVKPKEYKY